MKELIIIIKNMGKPDYEIPSNQSSDDQDFLLRQYGQFGDMGEGILGELTLENEILLKYLAQRNTTKQASRRAREEIQPIITERLRIGVAPVNEREYRTFTDMIQTLHPNSKLPTFEDFQSFVQINKGNTLGEFSLSSFFDEHNHTQHSGRIAISGIVDPRRSFYIGYFDIAEGKIRTIPLSREILADLESQREFLRENQNHMEQEEQERSQRYDVMRKQEYAPPYVLHPQEWKDEREDRIKNRMNREIQARMAEGFSTDADYAAIGRIETTHTSLMDDAKQREMHDRYIDEARIAWEETNNADDFYARISQIEQKYPDVDLFIDGHFSTIF